MDMIHVITGLGTGGAEAMLVKLLQASGRSDTAVVSMMDAGTKGSELVRLGIPVEELGMRRGVPTPAALWRLRKIVKRYRPSLIQGWMYHGNLAATAAGYFTPGAPKVIWNVRHSLYDIRDERPMTQRVIRANAKLSGKCDAIIYNSRISASQHEAFGFNRARSRVLPNGFDLSRFRPNDEARLQVRRELGVADGVPVIGMIGRFHPMKDHDAFLRAAKNVLARNPSVVFLAAGTGVERSNPALARLAAELGLGGSQLLLLGERNDVPRLMASLDVLALTSWSEGFPNVVGEAMACGVPCVVTDVGDAGWVVGDTGKVVPPRDVQAIAGACYELLELGVEERRALGAAARARVEDIFSLEGVAEQYQSLYSEVMG